MPAGRTYGYQVAFPSLGWFSPIFCAVKMEDRCLVRFIMITTNDYSFSAKSHMDYLSNELWLEADSHILKMKKWKGYKFTCLNSILVWLQAYNATKYYTTEISMTRQKKSYLHIVNITHVFLILDFVLASSVQRLLLKNAILFRERIYISTHFRLCMP